MRVAVIDEVAFAAAPPPPQQQQQQQGAAHAGNAVTVADLIDEQRAREAAVARTRADGKEAQLGNVRAGTCAVGVTLSRPASHAPGPWRGWG
eukprot:gene2469-58595_t